VVEPGVGELAHEGEVGGDAVGGGGEADAGAVAVGDGDAGVVVVAARAGREVLAEGGLKRGLGDGQIGADADGAAPSA